MVSTHYRMHARNGGFFSNFNGVINRLKYTVGPGDTCEVCWHANGVYCRGRTVPQSQFPYGTAEDGNLWLRFFEPLPFQAAPDVKYVTKDIWELDHAGCYFGSYRAWAKRQCRLYSPENIGWRSKFHDVYRQYVKPLPHIVHRVREFQSTHFADGNTVGVHIRNAKHGIEEIGKEAYDVSHFSAAIRTIYGQQTPTIFLATDNEAVIREMRDEFGSHVVYQKDVARSALNDTELHFNRQGDTRLGDDVLSDALLLASCDRTIHTNSNIATAVAFMNPAIQMHYIGRFETPLQAALCDAGRLFLGGRSLRRGLWRSAG